VNRTLPVRRFLVIPALALAIALLPASPVRADGPPDEPTWDASVFGSLWLSSLKATFDAGPVTASVNYGIDQLLPLLTWGVAGGVDGRYERAVFLLDALGIQLQDTLNAPARTVSLDPLGGPFGGLVATRAASSASLRVTEVMAEAAGGWRALSLPVSSLFTSVPADDPRRIRLDLLGGARYWYWRTEVRLSVPPVDLRLAHPPAGPGGLRGRIFDRVLNHLDLPKSIAVGGSNGVFQDVSSWTDAVIGFRLSGDVTRSVSLFLRSDIGGFGFGDSSSFTWQVLTGVEWRFAEHWNVAATWRAIGFDHRNVDNAILYGALLGVGYRF